MNWFVLLLARANFPTVGFFVPAYKKRSFNKVVLFKRGEELRSCWYSTIAGGGVICLRIK